MIAVVMPQRVDLWYRIDTSLNWSVDKPWLQPTHTRQRSLDIVPGNPMTMRPKGCPDELNAILRKAINDALDEFI